jgi:hypothetical protein
MKTKQFKKIGVAFVSFVALIIIAIGLTSISHASSIQSPDETNHLVGTWVGKMRPHVIWVEAKSIPVTIDIRQSGEITGMIRDATIINGIVIDRQKTFLGRMGMDHRGFIIKVNLQGNIIDPEQISRQSANIFFIEYKDEEWHGCSMHSSGSHVGGKKTMVLTAGNMILRKAEEVSEK